MEIIDFIYDYLDGVAPLGIPKDSPEFRNYRYLDKHLDSFEIIQFIMAVENGFSITLSPEDTEGERIRTVTGLVEIIQEKQRN